MSKTKRRNLASPCPNSTLFCQNRMKSIFPRSSHGALEVTLDRRTTDASRGLVGSPFGLALSPEDNIVQSLASPRRNFCVTIAVFERSSHSISERSPPPGHRGHAAVDGSLRIVRKVCSFQRRHSASIAMSKDRRSSLTKPTRLQGRATRTARPEEVRADENRSSAARYSPTRVSWSDGDGGK